MADKLQTILDGISKRFRDMGDGTHAEVVSVAGSGAVGFAAQRRAAQRPRE